MPLYPPRSDLSEAFALISYPVVFLLCWLFNAHRMGKVGKGLYRLGMLCGIALLLGAAVFLRS